MSSAKSHSQGAPALRHMMASLIGHCRAMRMSRSSSDCKWKERYKPGVEAGEPALSQRGGLCRVPAAPSVGELTS